MRYLRRDNRALLAPGQYTGSTQVREPRGVQPARMPCGTWMGGKHTEQNGEGRKIIIIKKRTNRKEGENKIKAGEKKENRKKKLYSIKKKIKSENRNPSLSVEYRPPGGRAAWERSGGARRAAPVGGGPGRAGWGAPEGRRGADGGARPRQRRSGPTRC